MPFKKLKPGSKEYKEQLKVQAKGGKNKPNSTRSFVSDPGSASRAAKKRWSDHVKLQYEDEKSRKPGVRVDI